MRGFLVKTAIPSAFQTPRHYWVSAFYDAFKARFGHLHKDLDQTAHGMNDDLALGRPRSVPPISCRTPTRSRLLRRIRTWRSASCGSSSRTSGDCIIIPRYWDGATRPSGLAQCSSISMRDALHGGTGMAE